MTETPPLFSEDQCKSFNAYQASGAFHPFTCGNDHDGDNELVATPYELGCPTCDFAQTWAHAWMLDWSWKTAAGVFGTLEGN